LEAGASSPEIAVRVGLTPAAGQLGLPPACL
jgi:hypothetical protein